jgi:DNA-directed RNA polymerase subunit M/transcription elongation factor TFIIS
MSMDKCGECGNVILKYKDVLLCTKCDAEEIAKRAKESYNKQFKVVEE